MLEHLDLTVTERTAIVGRSGERPCHMVASVGAGRNSITAHDGPKDRAVVRAVAWTELHHRSSN